MRANSDEARSVPTETQGCGRANKHATGKQFRRGNVDHFDIAAADLLENLFHTCREIHRTPRVARALKDTIFVIVRWLAVRAVILHRGQTHLINPRSLSRQDQVAISLLKLKLVSSKNYGNESNRQRRLRAVEDRNCRT